MKTILTTSYSPAIQGSYGIVCKEIFSRIVPTGKYRIISHGWFHIDPTEQVNWQVIPTEFSVTPSGEKQYLEADKFGEKSFRRVLQETKPDIVWALGDFYMLRHVFQEKRNFPTTRFICHLAVDGEPWHQGLIDFVRPADNIVAISKYGADVLSILMQKPIDHIYHGVNTRLMVSRSEEERGQLKPRLSGNVIKPTDFVIGWVGKDQFRKQNWKFWELMHYLIHGDYIRCSHCNRVTLKEFDKQLGISRQIGKLRRYSPNYDYSFCYHCKSKDIISGSPHPDVFGWSHMPFKPDDGWNPNQLGDIWRIRESIFQTANLGLNRGIPAEEMATIYNVMDMFYCMSGGEGFGLPVAESMACHVPTVYTNYSAHAEIAEGTGIPLDTDFTCEMNSCFDRAHADTADAISKLLPIIENPNRLDIVRQMGKNSREKIINLDWDIIGKQWLDYIDNVAKDIKHSSGIII